MIKHKHNFVEQGPNITCSCGDVLSTVQEFVRVKNKWIWDGSLTPDEDVIINKWLNIKPLKAETPKTPRRSIFDRKGAL